MTEQPIDTVAFPDGRIIPLDQLHYDREIGLHMVKDCDEIHGTRDRHEAGRALRERADALSAIQEAQRDQETAALDQLDVFELLEDMLVHLREMARRIRYRANEHANGTKRLTEIDRAPLVLEAHAVRTLANVLIGLHEAPTDAASYGIDHRQRATEKAAGHER